MSIGPVKEVIINGLVINSKTEYNPTWINSGQDAEFYAFDLFIHHAYPRYMKSEIEKRCGKQKRLTIIPSNHIKYKRQRIEHPEWFDDVS